MATDLSDSPQSPPWPLSIPIFRMVWISSLASNFGGLIQSVGASWMMISLASSPAMVALVQASTTLPIMFFSLFAGAIADNLDRRIVMLWAQSFMLLVSVILSIFAWTGLLTPWWLLTFTFLIGCGNALNGPSWQSSVGDMVPRPALPAAIALNGMGFNIARSAGPAIGGIIVAAAGAATAFLVNAVSYIGLIAVLARWRPNIPPRLLPRETMGVAMGAGLRYVAMSPKLRIVLVRAGAFGVAAVGIQAMMPLIAHELVSGGPLSYGILLGAFGIGAVVGALSSPRLRQTLSTEWIVRIATAVLAIGAAISAISHSMILTVFALLISGAGWVVALSTFNVTMQMSAPRWVVGRAIALYQVAAFGGMAGGSWLFGQIAESHGVEAALLATAATQAAGLFLGLLLPLPDVENLDLGPLKQWTEPDIAMKVEPRSGPIVVTIEYQIEPADIIEFLSAMNERRRIRLRDGARHWTLLRDLGEPDRWIERYHVPTWLDYIRHIQRRTQADADNVARIRALHQGAEGPIIRRMIERQTGSFPLVRAAGPHEMADPLTDATRGN